MVSLTSVIHSSRNLRLSVLSRLSALLGLAAILGSPQGAVGAPQVSANAEAAFLGSATPAQTASSGSVSDADSGLGDNGEPRYGVNTASAAFGSLSAYSNIGISARSSSFPYAALGTSTASFTDDWLISSAALNGTAGTLTVSFRIDGNLIVDKNGTPVSSASESSTYAQVTYAIGVGLAPGDFNVSQRLRYDGSTSGTPFLGIWQQYTLNFTYGTSLNDVTLRITTSAAAAGEASTYLSSTTAMASATWGGITEVRDSGGNLVTDYSFSSTSGTNFAQPVPEPTTASLGLLAAAALVGSRRLRRKG